MADTPQGKTRSNWWILGLVALVVLAGVIFFYARNGEERGGSLSAGESVNTAGATQSQNP
ncbi:MAG: hypothetical protein ACM3YN_13520 [Parcubacteria group bacterium]